METKSRSLFSNSLIYGLLTAAISIVFSVLMYLFDTPYDSPLMYFSFAILLAGMIYGTLTYRNNFLGGNISFGKAFISGFLIVLISALVSSIYSYVFMVFIDPSYLDKIIEKAVENAEAKMSEKGLSAEQMEPGLAMTRKFMSPVAMTIMAILSSALIGGILALIAAAFLKKEDKSFEGQFKNVE